MIHVHVVCWNEADLVPWICAHYSRFANHIFFHDNFSDDDTRALISHCPIAQVVDYDTKGEVRDDLLTKLKNTCWKNRGADWVICCDADEFVWIPGDTRATLARWETEQIAIPTCEWVEMIGDGIPPYAPGRQLYDVLDRGAPCLRSKCLLFNVNGTTEINYGVGAHTCNPRLKAGWAGPTNAIPQPRVLHFKHARGLRPLLHRHAAMAARFSALNRRHGLSGHWLDEQGTMNADRQSRLTAQSLERLSAFPPRNDL